MTSLALLALAQAPIPFRPPAVPLVACDPYFSIWSGADRLTDVDTAHWTGARQRLLSTVTVDGATYRLMGGDQSIPAMAQQGLEVTPTRSVYRFAGAGVAVTLTFTTPALPDDLDLLSRPVTYLAWDVKATNGMPHRVVVGYGNTGESAVDDPSQIVRWDYLKVGDLEGYRVGTTAQPVLGKTGDARRIDWGYLYAMAPQGWHPDSVPVGPSPTPGGYLMKPTAPASDPQVGWLHRDLGRVTSKVASAHIVLAYDDLFSVQYFGTNLRPYWRRPKPNGQTMDGPKLLMDSEARYAELTRRCETFDRELTDDLRRIGGERYALLAALAYRQTWAGSKIVADTKGQPLLFPKENTSNGCIGTVDVIFPMAPQVLLFGPSLVKALLVPSLDYASSAYWNWPFAPHDLGTYPKANGQVYGGGERTDTDQMPVEESGSLLILTLALAQMEGNADFARKYWPTLTRWAEYLRKEGFDPANQLSTDDYMGKLAHQTNLSIKATLGLGAYARLARMLGEPEAADYERVAHEFADRWVKDAADGDHFRLAFDRPGTWGQKYNLVWDRILNLGLYPDSVRRKEMAFYLAHRAAFGVPLDSRQDGTVANLLWTMWTATLTGDARDFEAMEDGVWRFANETPQRVGLGDLYDDRTGADKSFHNRPVVGGVFLKMLDDAPLWAKWAGRDATKAAGWAPLPKRPVVVPVVPTGETAVATWRFTTVKPAGDWFAAAFDASAWNEGPGGLGAGNPPALVVRSKWDTPDLWARREFDFASPTDGLNLRIFHDEDADVYLNGTRLFTLSGYSTAYDDVPLDARARGLLKPGRNVLAFHVHQTGGGQGLDAGLVRLVRRG